jgi:hypothetical protein
MSMPRSQLAADAVQGNDPDKVRPRQNDFLSPTTATSSSERPAEPPPSWVYALCRVEPRFPSLGVEKEFAQAAGRADTAGLTDRQALHELLTDRSNRYLARQLNWVATIEGLETYLLLPRDPIDLELLIDSIRPTPHATDVDVVIGERGPLAPPELANGLVVPIVFMDQMYSFDIDTLLKAIPRPEGMTQKDFGPAAEDLLSRIMQLADNAGTTDEHRALNHAAVRYPAIYAEAARAVARNSALSTVRVFPSRLSGVRNIVDIVFTFRNRQTGVDESFFARYDVTEEFPFLVTPLSPYYERP